MARGSNARGQGPSPKGRRARGQGGGQASQFGRKGQAKAQGRKPAGDYRGPAAQRDGRSHGRTFDAKGHRAQGSSSHGSRGGDAHVSAKNSAANAQRGLYVEGRRAVAEALEAHVPLKGIMVADRLLAPERNMAPLLQLAQEEGVPARTVPRGLLDKLSHHGAHQGVIAEARPYEYSTLSDLINASEGEGNALIVVCDHITDPGNLGAIARSAEVVGAVGLLVPNRRCAQVTATAYKASAGALAHIPIAMESNIVSCLERLKRAGFWVVGASEHASQSVWEAPITGRIALVLGSEGDGISSLAQKACDFLVALPQRGAIESLNVAQAATAIMYEWLRRISAEEGEQTAQASRAPRASQISQPSQSAAPAGA